MILDFSLSPRGSVFPYISQPPQPELCTDLLKICHCAVRSCIALNEALQVQWGPSSFQFQLCASPFQACKLAPAPSSLGAASSFGYSSMVVPVQPEARGWGVRTLGFCFQICRRAVVTLTTSQEGGVFETWVPKLRRRTQPYLLRWEASRGLAKKEH